jgi:murein DD-endopeptidase MepM/ murein hydrolase activator NlpD
MSMSESAALNKTRIAARIALASLLGAWLAGCSSDSTRLAESPFANPFASASGDDGAAAPRANLASNTPSQPNATYAAAAHPSPVAVSALPAPAPATTGAIGRPTTTQPITGFGNGWSATGGSPVVVADGENLDVVSRRYGVPPTAILQANGFTTPSQVHGGVRLIVPVYNAAGKSATAETVASKPKKAHDKEDADADAPVSKPKAKAKLAAQDKSDKSDKSAKADKVEKAEHHKKTDDAAATKTTPAGKPTAEAKPAKQDLVAKADAAAPAKKKNVDAAPTGSVNAEQAAPAATLTGAQADAAGVSPEFRWPARGRIIQGFKAGGNDGINIAVPEGTSVKAAESGVVAYAGSELKGYGNLVLIRHPNGFVSAYANNGELDVKRGESVKRGQIIAKSGQSGNVSSPQLHFELRKGSTPVDPTSFLAGL